MSVERDGAIGVREENPQILSIFLSQGQINRCYNFVKIHPQLSE